MVTEIPVEITFDAKTITLNEVSFNIPYDIIVMLLVVVGFYVVMRLYIGYSVCKRFEDARKLVVE